MQKKNASKHVTIITVLHNSSEVIEKCLSSIPEGIEVYVVDNASTDNSIEIVKNTRPSAKIIQNKKNIGFGRANNIALTKVITEFAFILNPDTVMRKDTIDNLYNTAKLYKDAAIIAPTIFYEDGRLQKTFKNSVFKRENSKNKEILRKYPSKIQAKGNTEIKGDLCAECISGAAMLLRVSMFKKIGFFDNNIFLFYEDDDICLKAKNEGYSLIVTTNSELTHLMGKSSPPTFKYIFRKNWHIMWSRLYLEKKYNGSEAAAKLANQQASIQFFKIIGHLLTLNKNKITKSIARMIAVIAFLMGFKAFPEND